MLHEVIDDIADCLCDKLLVDWLIHFLGKSVNVIDQMHVIVSFNWLIHLLGKSGDVHGPIKVFFEPLQQRQLSPKK